MTGAGETPARTVSVPGGHGADRIANAIADVEIALSETPGITAAAHNATTEAGICLTAAKTLRARARDPDRAQSVTADLAATMDKLHRRHRAVIRRLRRQLWGLRLLKLWRRLVLPFLKILLIVALLLLLALLVITYWPEIQAFGRDLLESAMPTDPEASPDPATDPAPDTTADPAPDPAAPSAPSSPAGQP